MKRKNLLVHLPQLLRNKWGMEAKEINQGVLHWRQEVVVCILYLDDGTDGKRAGFATFVCLQK